MLVARTLVLVAAGREAQQQKWRSQEWGKKMAVLGSLPQLRYSKLKHSLHNQKTEPKLKAASAHL